MMTWTRLFHIKNFEQALKRVVPNKPRTELAVSSRYQAEIRKEFRLAGVPWIYNMQPLRPNPRDQRPKPKKREAKRALRVEKIEKALK